jgi:16S rRNA (guanine966-N2)-methyltransferase
MRTILSSLAGLDPSYPTDKSVGYYLPDVGGSADGRLRNTAYLAALRGYNPPMRITGGRAARRILKVPKGLEVRPTPDLVKQAVFNSLGTRVIDAKVLELFAGTGALSLECLSRGAATAVCVEKSQRFAALLRENFQHAGFAPETLQIRVQDVFAAVAQLSQGTDRFNLVLADPPYGEKNVNRRSNSFAQQVLDNTQLPSLLAPGGLLVLGHSKRDTLTIPSRWTDKKLLKHGDSLMRFLAVT